LCLIFTKFFYDVSNRDNTFALIKIVPEVVPVGSCTLFAGECFLHDFDEPSLGDINIRTNPKKEPKLVCVKIILLEVLPEQSKSKHDWYIYMMLISEEF
jgi:hypothetical protein